MLIGLILIVVGIVFLLQNLGYLTSSAWSVVWPIIIVVLGLSFLFKKSWMWWGWHKDRESWHQGPHERTEDKTKE